VFEVGTLIRAVKMVLSLLLAVVVVVAAAAAAVVAVVAAAVVAVEPCLHQVLACSNSLGESGRMTLIVDVVRTLRIEGWNEVNKGIKVDIVRG
jgi:hypothetical protein